jgi:hypothetical protein
MFRFWQIHNILTTILAKFELSFTVEFLSRYLKQERQSSIKSMETYFSLLRQIVANSIVMTQIVSLTYLEYKVSLIRQTLFISLTHRTSITIYDILYYFDTNHDFYHKSLTNELLQINYCKFLKHLS